jgi:hypothetical protein
MKICQELSEKISQQEIQLQPQNRRAGLEPALPCGFLPDSLITGYYGLFEI